MPAKKKEAWETDYEKYGVNPSCKNSEIVKLYEAEPEKWKEFPPLEREGIKTCVIAKKFNPAKHKKARVEEIKESLAKPPV